MHVLLWRTTPQVDGGVSPAGRRQWQRWVVEEQQDAAQRGQDQGDDCHLLPKTPRRGHPPLKIEGRELERISCAMVLGIMISNDISWAAHVDYICPNANRRLYFVCMLRRAGSSRADLLTFYKAYVRSAVEYASAVWHTGLTGEQADRIESVQSIIEPGLSYHEALALTGLETLHARRERMARAFFEAILSPGHKLHHLLPDPRPVNYGLRRRHRYPATSLRTQRARRTLINTVLTIGSSYANGPYY